MKYYIAYPAPIKRMLETINSTLNVEAKVEEANNQVCSFESDKSFSELEIEVDNIGDDLWLLLNKEEQDEWLN